MATRRTLPKILCVGVDVTWWGGSSDRASQWETIVSGVLGDSELHEIQRIDLGRLPNPDRRRPTEPNFDADGGALVRAIMKAIECHPKVDATIVCLDSPLEAADRPGQPPRPKAAKKGESTGCRQRAAEKEISTFKRGQSQECGTWNRDLRIQAGSPIPCRIQRVVRALGQCGLEPYRAGSEPFPQGLVEIFPSEAIWSLGLMGHYGQLDSQAIRAYKAKRPRRLEAEAALQIARRPFEGFLRLLRSTNLPSGTADAWIERIVRHSVDIATIQNGTVRKAKSFDDPIDSGIAFFTAAACALGEYHEWGDGTDGTIVGPGRL